MSPKPPPLPDLDDEEFTQRLKPLETVMFSEVRLPASQRSMTGEARNNGTPEDRTTGDAYLRRSRIPGTHKEAGSIIRDTRAPDGSGDHALSGRNTEAPSQAAGRLKSHNTAYLESRIGESGVRRDPGVPETRGVGLVGAAERLTQIEQVRGPKRRFEYLIPSRVGDALAEDAARQGKSATTRLLEVLRDAGYPVIREDLIDLRKEHRR